MFKKHPYLWGALVSALALLNLWKWWPSSRSAPGTGLPGAWNGSSPLTLDFPEALKKEEKTVRRDPFTAGFSAAAGRAPKRAAAKPAPTAGFTPTPIPPAQLAGPDGSVAEAAGGYRLMGIASREGKSQALIGKGDRLFQVGRGETIEGRYQVGDITESEVYLTEKETGNTLKLRIWDPEGDKH